MLDNKSRIYVLIGLFFLLISFLILSFISKTDINQKELKYDNNTIKRLKKAYFNNSCDPILIDDSLTGVGAHNWTWAKNQEWCFGSGTWEDP